MRSETRGLAFEGAIDSLEEDLAATGRSDRAKARVWLGWRRGWQADHEQADDLAYRCKAIIRRVLEMFAVLVMATAQREWAWQLCTIQWPATRSRTRHCPSHRNWLDMSHKQRKESTFSSGTTLR
jgi:hypothetical protein